MGVIEIGVMGRAEGNIDLQIWAQKVGYIDVLKSKTYIMYRQFNIQQLYVLPTQCIYVFCVDLRTNSDYFPIQH